MYAKAQFLQTIASGSNALINSSKVGVTVTANVAQSEEDVNQQNISRINVERLNIRYWNIIIREVRINDSGAYICQINT
ncbi:hypothetical protein DPMN_055960 [Dreissena polymorpha]|uniref:Uncharacterized protein n=1 Tax=Dreissena polymorpha TaxID=45954 RepID=A0A9D4CSR5_DREPO|nr:hypothetical protein DPMN_055960 [Dreissena polymorpha]